MYIIKLCRVIRKVLLYTSLKILFRYIYIARPSSMYIYIYISADPQRVLRKICVEIFLYMKIQYNLLERQQHIVSVGIYRRILCSKNNSLSYIVHCFPLRVYIYIRKIYLYTACQQRISYNYITKGERGSIHIQYNGIIRRTTSFGCLEQSSLSWKEKKTVERNAIVLRLYRNVER